MTVRLSAPRPRQGTSELAAALAELDDHAVVRVRVRRDMTIGDVAALLDTMRADRRPIALAALDDGVELEGGPRATEADDHVLDATVLHALVEARSDLRRLHALLDQERRSHGTRLDKVRDSTQYRLGSALLDVVRRPTGIVRLPRELRELQRRRVRPPSTPSSASVDHVHAALDVRTASILDEFTHDCFAQELDLVPLPRRDWIDELAEADLVFVESAWRGNRGAWTYTLSNFATDGSCLLYTSDAADDLYTV